MTVSVEEKDAERGRVDISDYRLLAAAHSHEEHMIAEHTLTLLAGAGH